MRLGKSAIPNDDRRGLDANITPSALASLDPSGEAHEDAASRSEAASPPAARNRSKSPLAAEKANESTA